ncbi:uncharacterized protein A4U43_C03F380 [Asparagus officinalis]|uniref:Glutathione S-transferase n=1 Tax=Asparagus officinalis TaxID=4686 RepID=A0A5P1F648_ASPOF|nr:glutathione S-transferase U10-like [Asparagus officinalis]ONK73866.1 uncharacterized protein A4U43_C03F380 [Asparagus officinalis]
MQTEAKEEVKLHGFWASSDCAMVRHALKLKGVAYDYVEVDIDIRSDSLVRVYENVPVLVVDGQSVTNPLVIFEFIEDNWKYPALFPEDPYMKSRVRFWAGFFYKKLMPTSFAIMFSEGEAQEKATEEFIEHMRTMEDGIAVDFANGGPFINGKEPGLLDVVMGSCSNGLKALGAVPGVQMLDKERMPVLSSAIEAFIGLETSTVIPYDELLELHWVLREIGLATASSKA